jgi:SAM-dependent methyltransferase
MVSPTDHRERVLFRNSQIRANNPIWQFRESIQFPPGRRKSLLRAVFRSLLLLAAVQGGHSKAQVATRANQEYSTAERRQAAAWEMEHPNRPGVEQSERLVESFKIKPGDVVADIGTGVGYMLPLLRKAVGPTGRVIAQDIYADFLARVNEKIKINGWNNVTTILGIPADPNLPHGEIDVVLAVDVYHHLDYPGETISSVRKSLKPGGRLIVVDFYRSRKHPRGTFDDLHYHIRADRDEFATEIALGGFRLADAFDHLHHEYVLVFHPESRDLATYQLLREIQADIRRLDARQQ